jgi:hypothetical protein
MSEKLIDPQAAVDFMIAKSKAYAQAEGNKVYMEEVRKTVKAEQMSAAELRGHKTAAIQEREAYASAPYKQHLLALQLVQQVVERVELRAMRLDIGAVVCEHCAVRKLQALDAFARRAHRLDLGVRDTQEQVALHVAVELARPGREFDLDPLADGFAQVEPVLWIDRQADVADAFVDLLVRVR